MYSVKIYGAGSIGNHLSYACRNKDWDVTVCDIDESALSRMKNYIYPDRYGKWDNEIVLTHNEQVIDNYLFISHPMAFSKCRNIRIMLSA